MEAEPSRLISVFSEFYVTFPKRPVLMDMVIWVLEKARGPLLVMDNHSG